MAKANPFEIVKAINAGKNLIKEDPDRIQDYIPFLINRSFSYFPDTILYANEMNIHHAVDPILQHDFMINIIRPKKRFSKWAKKEDNDKLELIKEYFGYGNFKAKQALSVLTEHDIETIKIKLEKGG